MEQVLQIEHRQPRRRSPEELRLFYNIALHAKDDIGCDSQSIAPRSWASGADGRAQSSRGASLFSRRATIASSATSISDIKAPTASASRQQYEAPPSQLTLPCLPNTSLNNNNKHIRWGLSTLRDARLGLGCRLCRLYNLGCDRAKPSCSNCVQNFAQCFYIRAEDSIVDEPACQPPVRPVPVAEPRQDLLDKHPYYSLEDNRKFGRVDTWYLKLRSRRPSTAVSQNAESIDIEPAVEADRDPLLREGSPQPFLLDDGIEDAALMRPILTTKSDRPSGESLSCTSSREILVDLGAVPNPSQPTECLYPSHKSISSSSKFGSEEGWSTGVGDVAEYFSETPLHSRDLSIRDFPSSFHCLFCWKRFDNQKEWEVHEADNHINRQSDWVCMPGGFIVNSDNKKSLCAFCGAADPDSSHALQHEAEDCLSKILEDRAFRSKLDFQSHLQEVHNLENITEWMDTWRFSREDDAGYWNCGFCNRSFGRWSDRVRHISKHFRKGLTIASWDPLVSPYPIERNTGNFISWFPPVNTKKDKSFTAQLELLKRVTSTSAVKQPYNCQNCTIALATSADAQRHEEIWHSPRDIWSCPTTSTDIVTATHFQAGPLASYLFPESPESDHCPYCHLRCTEIFSPDLADESVDWAMRVEHLRDVHGFDRCEAGLRFYSDDLFLLHLAGCHELSIKERVGEIVDGCWRGKRMLEDIWGR